MVETVWSFYGVRNSTVSTMCENFNTRTIFRGVIGQKRKNTDMKIVILCTDFRNFLTSYMDNFVVWTVLKFRDSKPKTARYVLRNDNCENRLKFPKLLKNCRDRFQFRFYVTVLPILPHVAHKFQVIRCWIFENFDFFEILIKYRLGPITYILRCRIIYTDRITLSVAEKKIDHCRKKWRTPL